MWIWQTEEKEPSKSFLVLVWSPPNLLVLDMNDRCMCRTEKQSFRCHTSVILRCRINHDPRYQKARKWGHEAFLDQLPYTTILFVVHFLKRARVPIHKHSVNTEKPASKNRANLKELCSWQCMVFIVWLVCSSTVLTEYCGANMLYQVIPTSNLTIFL